MKFYVASKFERKAEVREAMRRLRLAGHTIVGDWTSHSVEGITDPEERDAMLRAYAKEDMNAVITAGALLLIHDSNCRGGFVELGMALAAGKRVFVVGGEGLAAINGPIFYYLPEVQHFESMDAFMLLGLYGA